MEMWKCAFEDCGGEGSVAPRAQPYGVNLLPQMGPV